MRSVVDDDPLAVDSFQSYAPYGEGLDAGPFGSPFTFTGEQADASGLLYLRARTYHPALGVFASPRYNFTEFAFIKCPLEPLVDTIPIM